MIRRHEVPEVAALIGKSDRWLRRHAHALPHSRAGQTFFWTDDDLRALFAHLSHRPAAVTQADELRPITGTRRRAS